MDFEIEPTVFDLTTRCGRVLEHAREDARMAHGPARDVTWVAWKKASPLWDWRSEPNSSGGEGCSENPESCDNAGKDEVSGELAWL